MADTRNGLVSAIDHRYRSGPPGGALVWVLGLLALYIGFWVVHRDFAQYNLDRHGDMVENFAWGIAWQLGYDKHPPLFGWITAAWFSVFPRTNAAYYLLSSVNVAAAAIVMWLISRRFLTEWQQVVAVAMIFVLPPLSFHAMDYNANAGMLPFWALAFLFYLRAIERRSILDACLVGLFCGLAMLVKYHSLVLIIALSAHFIWDRETRPLLRSELPWAAAITGAIVVAPHAWWIVQSGFTTVTYAAEQGDGTFATALSSVGSFLVAFLLYSLPGVVIALLYWRKPKAGAATLIPAGWRDLTANAQGRALLFVGPGSALLTMIIALALSAQLSSLWVMPFFFTVPILLALAVSPANAAHYWYAAPAAVVVFCAIVLAMTPWLRSSHMQRASSNTVVPVSVLAQLVQDSWHERTATPLAIVASRDDFLANGVSFYAPDTPQAVQGSFAVSPWVSAQDVERLGAVFICLASTKVPGCDDDAATLLGAIDDTVELSIPAVEGAGGPREWAYILYMRYPAALRQQASN
jgi:4-amino-4-deoxy-L-arabinose transferase-like glycosyltransferase